MGKEALKTEVLGLVKELSERKRKIDDLDARAQEFYRQSQSSSDDQAFIGRLEALRDMLQDGLYGATGSDGGDEREQ